LVGIKIPPYSIYFDTIIESLWLISQQLRTYGLQQPSGDVDLLVVYQGTENDQAYATVKKAMSIPHLEPHVCAEEDYRTMQDIIQKMITGGVVIYRRE